MIKFFIIFIILLGFSQITFAAKQKNWIITQLGSQQTYNTFTEIGERKGISRKGLISISKNGSNVLQVYWEPGAHRATILFNNTTIVDGHDVEDISRIKSFRFNKNGDTAFIRTTKGPKAIVELIYNGKSIFSWPRLSIVNILSFKRDTLYVSYFSKEEQATEFWRYNLITRDTITIKNEIIGKLENCALLGSKVLKSGIAVEAYCSPEHGSDIKFLDFSSGKFQTIKATKADEFLAYSWAKYNRDTIPVLSVSGTENARQLYHAISASISKYLGEPIAYASDESGKQSWSQSYRALTLATLYKKTGLELFARLSEQSMTRTLNQQNKFKSISGTNNPSCAWASRIYSIDGKSPISFMINQGMISSSLMHSCTLLGDKCPLKLKTQIFKNATCLVSSYEYLYDQKSGLYRIPYDAPFRYDGILAPWNWHMMWLSVLKHVSEQTEDKRLQARVHFIKESFIKSWEFTNEESPQALWRYWPSQFYQGWKKEDLISISRPAQSPKKMRKERYEDINHASISLLGLSLTNTELPEPHKKALQKTLNKLLNFGSLLPRDMDGKGPFSPRWLPGAGWDMATTPELEHLYSRHLPGASTGDQHLAYAQLYNPSADYELNLTLSDCTKSGCKNTNNWSHSSVHEFVSNNPLFSVDEIHK
ncbi:MAG: hypothetical protein V7776_19775 [Halopseudomonas aestusnigri]